MIIKRVIDHCEFIHDIYGDCKHCRYRGYTCDHACRVLRVKRPLEYTINMLNNGGKNK